MKPPTQCTCPIHQKAAANNYAGWSRDPKLIRLNRRNDLANAAKRRKMLSAETDPEERAWLKQIIICAEWGARVCLTLLREIRKEKR